MSGARSAAASAALALTVALGCHENPRVPAPPSRAQLVLSERSLETVEGGPAATFDVALLTTPAAPVEVEVRSEDAGEGLVLAPGYAHAAEAQLLTFTPEDWSLPRRVAVQPVTDHVADGDATYAVVVRISYTEDALYAATPAGSVTVTNVDVDVPALVLAPRQLTTRENGPRARFTVRLATIPTSTVVVALTIADPTEGLLSPVPGQCSYGTSTTTSLWFYDLNWDVPQSVGVCPQDDPYADGDRTYSVVASIATSYAPEYQAVASVAVEVTNADDDAASLLVSPTDRALVTGENGLSSSFIVSLGTPPLADVVVPVESSNPAEGLVAIEGGTPAARLELTFTDANWYLAQTVWVVGQDDLAAPVVGDEVAYVVNVGPPIGADPGYALAAARTVAAVNLDDDLVELTIDPAGPFTTSETGTTAVFTVSIRPPKENVFVTVTTGDPAEGRLLAGGFEPAPVVTLLFGPESWGPQQVTIVGQPDQVLDGDVRYLVTVAVASGDARYVALGPVGLAVTNTADLASSVPLATYDPGFGAPRCASVGFGCGSGTLLTGRDGVPGAPEAHAPNTLTTAPACPDGTYTNITHALDELKVFTLDASPLAARKRARIEAKVRLYWWSGEFLDLYSAADASAPAWTFVATLQPPPGSIEWSPVVLGTTFDLPSGTTQAIRGNWRYGGYVPSTCSSGSLDDHDDFVFEVAPR